MLLVPHEHHHLGADAFQLAICPSARGHAGPGRRHSKIGRGVGGVGFLPDFLAALGPAFGDRITEEQDAPILPSFPA